MRTLQFFESFPMDWNSEQGRRQEVLIGERDECIGTQTHLPQKFSVSSDFGHFILKMLESANNLNVSRKRLLQYTNFW